VRVRERVSVNSRVVTGNVDGTDGELSEAGGWRRDENTRADPTRTGDESDERGEGEPAARRCHLNS